MMAQSIMATGHPFIMGILFSTRVWQPDNRLTAIVVFRHCVFMPADGQPESWPQSRHP